MDKVAIIISLISLSFTVYTYYMHDKKLKKQASILNEYQIGKINKEKEEKKKAIIEAIVINKGKGKKLVRVYNKGKAIAKNVFIKFPEKIDVHIFEYPIPIDIKPQNSIEIGVQRWMSSPTTLQIDFEWQDDFILNNKDSQILQI